MGIDARQAAGVDVRGDPLDLGAPAGVIPEELCADSDGRLGLHRDHARVERLEFGQFVCVLVDQFTDAPEHLGPLAGGQAFPDTRLGGLLRTRNGSVDGLWATVLELGDLLLGGRIENRNYIAGARSFTDLIQHSLHRHGLRLCA